MEPTYAAGVIMCILMSAGTFVFGYLIVKKGILNSSCENEEESVEEIKFIKNFGMSFIVISVFSMTAAIIIFLAYQKNSYLTLINDIPEVIILIIIFRIIDGTRYYKLK
ncbi:hypothetical protein JK636_12440 [Clostridium sp. YIM B02515]|uniref:DUF3784 domain-containing protein n=1 Tax=Clostridium rhizosphaerae TaxID=2803861 RepID=A0ABS1TBT2_9CLOT|nr:hypothetical protein [Clostridium rhizosphaerae]MBL4936567.1 hypothetical protein [Clostridium rhizosphaerae]